MMIVLQLVTVKEIDVTVAHFFVTGAKNNGAKYNGAKYNGAK